MRYTGTLCHRPNMQAFQVFSVLAKKGGVGKSLLARSLAVQALMDGQKAAILDADPQGTIVSWGNRREHAAPLIIGVGSRTIRDALEEIKDRGGEVVFIDTPPHAQPVINVAAESADACLLVTGPYPEDLEQVGSVASIVTGLRKPAGIILNKAPPRAQALTLARSALTTFNLPTCPTAITQIVGHPYASAEGLSIQEREPRSKGAVEMASVWKWVESTVRPSLNDGKVVSHHTCSTPSRRTMKVV